MKTNLIKQIKVVTKLSIYILLIVFTNPLFASSYGQGLQDIKVTINVSQGSILEVFENIEDQSSFRFMYDNEIKKEAQTFSVNRQDISIYDVLGLLSKEFRLKFKRINNSISVTKIPDEVRAPMLPIVIQVTGKVVDERGQPLPGATILVKGTTIGTTTDFDGIFNLEIPEGYHTLQISYIGYMPTEVMVEEGIDITIVLKENTNSLDEVVVTALGIKKQKGKLSYATEKLDLTHMGVERNTNLGNSLASKIAGLNVTSSTGATGVIGAPRIIIRGSRSINGNNQPLIVVDGVPYGIGGAGLQSINPDDIYEINVLKGPAAGALYGSSANNGVIVVTTKKGDQVKTEVNFNSTTSFDIPYLYPEFQNTYAQGLDGIYLSNAEASSWGPRMEGQNVINWTGETIELLPQPNNIKDFFRTGVSTVNGFTYSSGNSSSTQYFSLNRVDGDGILPTNRLERNSVNFRLTKDFNTWVSLDARINYFDQKVEGTPEPGDDLYSPLQQLIRMPRSIRTKDIEQYFYYDDEGSFRQNTWVPNSTLIANPYWSVYGIEDIRKNDVLNALASVRFSLTKDIYLQLRGNVIVSNADSETKTYWDAVKVNSGKGEYVNRFSKSQTLNGDVLVGFDKKIMNNLDFGLSLGASIIDTKKRSMEATAGGLSTENKFSMAYALAPVTTDAQSHVQKQSLYGIGQLSYKDQVLVDFTARNDWSSTLPSPYSYFYPSVGLTTVVSEIIQLPKPISYVKLRGSYAEVGNDANFAQIFQTYGANSSGPLGTIGPSTTKAPTDLIPENTKSWEVGTELGLFQNRFTVDLTWYKSNTYNQLISTTFPYSSGYRSALVNTGNIQNQGVELMVGATPVVTDKFRWDLNFNYSKNNSEVVSLKDGVERYEIDAPSLSIGETWLVVGRPYGEVFSKGYMRDEQGNIIVNEQGIPYTTSSDEVYLGNFNYDWQASLNNTLRFGNWHLNFLIDLNHGGVRQSATESNMLYTGTSAQSLIGREDGILIEGVMEDGSPNTIRVPAQAYALSVAGREGLGELFNHSATNSRLRELSIGYTFLDLTKGIKELHISMFGRNLFYFYNGSDWFDPDGTYNTDRNGQGAESAFLPGSRTVGLNLKITL